MALTSLRSLLGASALAFSLIASPSLADTIFTQSNDGFAGNVSAASAERGKPLYKGGKATIAGQNLIPGQEITLMRGTTVLNTDGALVVDGEGKFSFDVAVDADAVTGLQPILVVAEKPAAATVVELKISPEVPVAGAEKFTILSEPVTRGLYQVAYSAANDALFVTAAVGRPPVKESVLSKVNADTLKVEAQISPEAAPARPDGSDGGVFAVYGVAVDDTNGNIWITNTRQNTISVYKQADLSLVKQFDVGTVPHAFSIEIDEANSRAYVSAARNPLVDVFDTTTLEKLEPIALTSAKRGEEFLAQGIDLDAAGGKLLTVSLSSAELAVTDLKANETKVIALPGAKGAAGVAYDPQEDLAFVTSQGTDNVLIVKVADGTVLHDVETGAGALYVTFEPKSRLAFVGNRGSGTITVVNTSGEIVANLDAGSFPNQLIADGRGNVYAVNKSQGEDDPAGDRVWKITPVAN